MATKAPFVRDLSAVTAAVATGSDATVPIGRAPFAGAVSAVTYAPAGDITGAATNNRRFQLINKGQDGNGTTVIATLSFGNGTNAADFDEKVIPLSGTAADLNVAAGDVLAWFSDSVGTGIADPGGLVTVSVSRS